jgi:predicted acyl esterase
VPFVPRPVHLRDRDVWTTWLVADQSFVSDRPDVISFTSAPLDKPVHIAGQPMVDLFAATSGTDSDWVVKLIDVYPDEATGKPKTAGMQLPVGIEIYRGRYVHGFPTPAALTPGKTENYKFGLPHVNHVFAPGHRIMVQVQSSLFPLYDRNITRLVEQAGADVLPIFNATWSRSDNHPPLRKGGVRLRNSAFDRAFANRTVSDCTHYCSRGSVLRFWTQALVSWLEET